MENFEFRAYAVMGELDGYVHVDNFVGYRQGQHHVHTREGYLNWKKQFNLKEGSVMEYYDEGGVGWRKATPDSFPSCKYHCRCELAPGQAREYDGSITEGFSEYK